MLAVIVYRDASAPTSPGRVQVKINWTIDLKSLLKCAQLVTDLSMLISLYLHIRFKWTLFFWHLRCMACEPRHPEADQYWTDQPVDSFAWWPVRQRCSRLVPFPSISDPMVVGLANVSRVKLVTGRSNSTIELEAIETSYLRSSLSPLMGVRIELLSSVPR